MDTFKTDKELLENINNHTKLAEMMKTMEFFCGLNNQIQILIDTASNDRVKWAHIATKIIDHPSSTPEIKKATGNMFHNPAVYTGACEVRNLITATLWKMKDEYLLISSKSF